MLIQMLVSINHSNSAKHRQSDLTLHFITYKFMWTILIYTKLVLLEAKLTYLAKNSYLNNLEHNCQSSCLL